MKRTIATIEDIFNVVTESNKISIECAVGVHTISIVNFEYYERMSEETNCFVGDLVLDGNIVGECRNEGRGGCSSYYANKNWELARDIDSLLRDIPNYCFPKLKRSLDEAIDNLAEIMINFQLNNAVTEKKAIAVANMLQKSADKYKKMYSV